ncbi:MAG: hypothetical protein PHW37_01670 [Acholeplasmataceae bacterium]|nr:hypothetical protein [Acholeplasmataceae bacterium]
MKKILKLFGITIVIVAVLAVTLIGFSMLNEAYYYKSTKTEQVIDTKYAQMGELEVSSKEYSSDDEAIKKFIAYYPTKLDENKYPIVLWANGTGSTSDTYKAFFKHLASWGFVVVGNDDKNTRSGSSLNKTIDLLIEENGNKDSIFYQKLDLNNIGIGGHSQGGPAVFNMVTNQSHKDMIKCVYAASPTSSYHTAIYGGDWIYDISKVNVPTFMAAGTGLFDAGTATSKDQVNDDSKNIAQGITPLWSLEENYSLLPNGVDKIYARKDNTDHGDSYKQFDGYMTAWFVAYLKDDSEAIKAFTIDGELSKNSLYQDFRSNIKAEIN